MDFRINRTMQDKSVNIVSGGTVLKNRDYTIPCDSNWNEGVTEIEVKIKTQLPENLTQRRNDLVRVALAAAEPCGTGVRYQSFVPFVERQDDALMCYALLSGIVDQLGKGTTPNPVSDDVVRVMWFADLSQIEGSFQETINSRWDDMAYGSLVVGPHSIKIAGTTLKTSEITVSPEYSDLHLRHIDIDVKQETAKLVFTEDRSITEFWYGYIPPCFGGKPSALSHPNQMLSMKHGISPIDLRRVRELKAKEIDRSDSAKFAMFNRNHYFEYLKDVGKTLRVTE